MPKESITVPLPADLSQALEDSAARLFLSKSDIVRWALREWLELHEGKGMA